MVRAHTTPIEHKASPANESGSCTLVAGSSGDGGIAYGNHGYNSVIYRFQGGDLLVASWKMHAGDMELAVANLFSSPFRAAYPNKNTCPPRWENMSSQVARPCATRGGPNRRTNCAASRDPHLDPDAEHDLSAPACLVNLNVGMVTPFVC